MGSWREDGHWHSRALEEADNAWLYKWSQMCGCTNVRFVPIQFFRYPFFQMSVVQMPGYTIVSFSSYQLYSCPILQIS